MTALCPWLPSTIRPASEDRSIRVSAAPPSTVEMLVRTPGWLSFAEVTASLSMPLMALSVSPSGQTAGEGTIEAAGAQVGHSYA